MAKPKTRSTRQPATQEVTVVKITASPKRRRGRPPKRVVTTGPDVNHEEEEEQDLQEEVARDPSPSAAAVSTHDVYSVPASPEPEQRTATAQKRSASEMDSNNSPAAAKRRRMVTFADNGKRPAAASTCAAAARRVDPVVLSVLNQGARQLKGMQGPKIVVEIPRQRGLPQGSSGVAPPSAQPQGRKGIPEEEQEEEEEDEEEENEDEDEEEEEAEEDVDSALLEPPTPKAPASRSVNIPNPTATGGRTNNVVNRPGATQAGPSDSAQPGPGNSSGHDPTRGTQVVHIQDDSDSGVETEERDDGEHDAAYRSQLPPAPAIVLATATFETFPNEENAEETNDEDEEGNFEARMIDIPLAEISSIAAQMGLRPWTNLGKDWSHAMLNQPIARPRNEDIAECCHELLTLRHGFSKAPRYPNLRQQTEYLFGKRELASQSCEKILPYIDRIAQQLRPGDRQARKKVVAEVCQHLVPLLVLLLRHFCLLGGAAKNQRNELQLSSHGTFTWAAVHLPGHVIKWLKKVSKPLADHIEHELDAWDHGRRPSMSEQQIELHEKRQKTCAAILGAFNTFDQHIEALQTIVDRPKYVWECRLRDAKIKQRLVEEARAAEEHRQARYRAFARSIRQLKYLPNPIAIAEAEVRERAERETQAELRREQAEHKRWMERQRHDQEQQQRQPQLPRQPEQPRQVPTQTSRSRPAAPAIAQPSSSIQQRSKAREESPEPHPWTAAENELLRVCLSGAGGKALGSDSYELLKNLTGHGKNDVKKQASILKRYARQEAHRDGHPAPDWAVEL